MFNFFGKKNQFKEPQPPTGLSGKSGSAQTSTKVEDDVASFEIPDFTEDDLNFDLGMSEFMPEQGDANQPQVSPKVVPPEKTQEAEQPKPAETPADAKPAEPLPEDQEEIPKFNVAPLNDDAQKTEDMPELPEVKMKKPESVPAVPKHKPYGYSTEGIYMAEEKYKRTVILVDDTMKKAEKAQTIKTDSFMLSDSKKQNVDKLSKLLKSITESLMDADAKLFEQGDAK